MTTKKTYIVLKIKEVFILFLHRCRFFFQLFRNTWGFYAIYPKNLAKTPDNSFHSPPPPVQSVFQFSNFPSKNPSFPRAQNPFPKLINQTPKKREANRDGWLQGRRWIWLSVQACADRRFRCWKIQSFIEVHQERVQSWVKIHYRRWVCHQEP